MNEINNKIKRICPECYSFKNEQTGKCDNPYCNSIYIRTEIKAICPQWLIIENERLKKELELLRNCTSK